MLSPMTAPAEVMHHARCVGVKLMEGAAPVLCPPLHRFAQRGGPGRQLPGRIGRERAAIAQEKVRLHPCPPAGLSSSPGFFAGISDIRSFHSAR
jgi:hypothetical protein